MKKNKGKIIKFAIISFLVDVCIAGIIVYSTYYFMYKVQIVPSSDISSTQEDALKIQTADKRLEDWTSKFKDKFSNEVVETDNTYKSRDVSISIEKKSQGEGKGKITYYLADIYIANINCFKTGFAKDTYGTNSKDYLVNMSNQMQSIIGINGDSYGNNMHQNSGTTIRNGIVYRDRSTTSDVCVLYKNGEMKTYSGSEFDTKKAIEDGAYQTWVFGPSLLDKDGKQTNTFSTWDYIKKSHPRTAIGYYEPRTLCFFSC